MEDMDAFERQLATVMQQGGRPSLPVDATATVRSAVTSAPTGRWTVITRRLRGSTTAASTEGGFSVFSALKFVAAAAIVALFGGFLLAGVLTTQQGDEMAPAAVTESPSVTTNDDILPGVTLTVEEVEPGVFRVVHDGVRDLASLDAEAIAAGYDGGVRLRREDDFIRLGSDETVQWPVVPSGDIAFAFEVAPDGTMWVIPCRAGLHYPKQCGDTHRSTDGKTWTREPCPAGSEDCQGFTVAPDGTAWATWRVDGSTSASRWRVGHLEPTGWQPLDEDARYDSGPFHGYRHMIVTDAGDVYGMASDYIYRYEDGGWEIVAPRWGGVHDIGPDGTVWFAGGDGLVRFTDGEWEHWAPADLPDMRYGFGSRDEVDLDAVELDESRLEVAPDGSVWFDLWRNSADPRIRDEDPDDFYSRAVEVRLMCDGLTRFDGQTLDRFLPGRCTSMDIAPDGSVWVLAADDLPWVYDFDVDRWGLADDHAWGLYVITPEAVAATEVTDIEVATTTTSDVLPGVTLAVEEVETGVFRVVNDGVRDVKQVHMTAVGDDGSVWVDSAKGILELGRAGEHPGLVGGEGFLVVAGDGTLWAESGDGHDGPAELRSFDGEMWTDQGAIPDGTASVPDPWWPADYILDLAVHPDGSVWQVAAQLRGDVDAYPRLQHLGSDTWMTYVVGEGLPNPGWCDLCVEGKGCECDEGWDVEITPDGTVWVGISEAGLLRSDGTDWEVVRPLGGDEDHGIVGLASNRDGVLWAGFESGYLARFDGRAWGAVSHAPAPDPDTRRARSVDPDGNLWVGWNHWDPRPSEGCDGIRRFDGSTWMTFLAGECVADIEIASDGAVWVTVPSRAGPTWVPGFGNAGDLYVITPEAVAAAE